MSSRTDGILITADLILRDKKTRLLPTHEDKDNLIKVDFLFVFDKGALMTVIPSFC